MMEPQGGICAVVPIRSLRNSKTRLADTLGEAERAALVSAMAEDVIDALRHCRAVSNIVIVTDDPGAAGLARGLGCEVWPQGPREGLSAAMELAAATLSTLKVSTMVSVHADLPFVTTAAFDRLLARVADQPHIVIVPSNVDSGSNIIVTTPPHVLPFQYGPESYRQHIGYCGEKNILAITFRDCELGFDLDTGNDFQLLLQTAKHRSLAPRTQGFLEESSFPTSRLARSGSC